MRGDAPRPPVETIQQGSVALTVRAHRGALCSASIIRRADAMVTM